MAGITFAGLCDKLRVGGLYGRAPALCLAFGGVHGYGAHFIGVAGVVVGTGAGVLFPAGGEQHGNSEYGSNGQ